MIFQPLKLKGNVSYMNQQWCQQGVHQGLWWISIITSWRMRSKSTWFSTIQYIRSKEGIAFDPIAHNHKLVFNHQSPFIIIIILVSHNPSAIVHHCPQH